MRVWLLVVTDTPVGRTTPISIEVTQVESMGSFYFGEDKKLEEGGEMEVSLGGVRGRRVR